MAVEPERFAGWLTRFAARHGPVVAAVTPGTVSFRAADGALAACQVPFPPLEGPDGVGDPTDPARALVAHARTDRRVGVLLVRLGGHAAGVFVGPRLVASKVGSRPVHGRSAAGGWSQHRFARRREGQVRVAHAAAADTAAHVLTPAAATLAAVVTGGERRAVDRVLADRRLAPVRRLVVAPFLDVPDPRLRILIRAPGRFRAIHIHVSDPATPAGTPSGRPAPGPEEPRGAESADG